MIWVKVILVARPAEPATGDVDARYFETGSEGCHCGEGSRARRRAATPTMRRRLLLLVIVLAAIAAAGAGAWATLLRPITVQVSHAEANVAVQVFGLGTVEARVTSKVGFKVSGVLVDLRADVGDRVAKGAVLARLDDREQSAQVARAKATVEQAQATLQKDNASVEKAKANYANAKNINERRQTSGSSAVALRSRQRRPRRRPKTRRLPI